MSKLKPVVIIFVAIVISQVGGHIALAQQPTIGNTRISIGYDGSQADGDSYNPIISNNGRFVMFASDATNLVPYDTNGTTDVFVFDLETEVMERVSVASNGVQGNKRSGFDNLADISNDGRYVVFSSEASNLVADDNVECQQSYLNDKGELVTIISNCMDVFLKDRLTNVTRLISLSSLGAHGNGYSYLPSMSADGRYVAFASSADNLVENDHNEFIDIFAHDLHTGETRRVSVATGGAEANALSFFNTISANGRYVVFETFANNLSPDDTDNQLSVYMHDLQTGETSHIAVGFPATIYDRYALMPNVSADGRYVSFLSDLRDGHEGDAQIYRRDRQAGTTEIVSLSAGGDQGNKAAYWSSISDNGQWVAFVSQADNLVNAGGTVCNDCENVYLKDMATGDITLISKSIAGNYAGNSKKYPAITSISGDGSRVVFDAISNNLVLGDSNGHSDIFVYGWKTTPTYQVNLPLIFRKN